MTNLGKVFDEAMNLYPEQQEKLLQILQRRMMKQCRNEIALDAKLSLTEFKVGKLEIQTALLSYF